MRAPAVCLLAVLAAAPPAAAELTVTHVANEGFLLAAGDERVLVDALFDGGIAGYGQIPDGLRPALEAGEPPFDGVDLVLATHFHRDHFGPRAVAAHLAANPEALFVSTPQAVAALAAEVGETSPLLERARALLPDERTRMPLEHRGIELEVMQLHHGRGREAQNLGFLLRLGGVAVLHVGDTEVVASDLEGYGFENDTIDLLLAPSWLCGYDHWRTAVERIGARRIAVMHLAQRDAPPSFFGRAGSYDGVVERVRAGCPGARIFERPLETETVAAPQPGN